MDLDIGKSHTQGQVLGGTTLAIRAAGMTSDLSECNVRHGGIAPLSLHLRTPPTLKTSVNIVKNRVLDVSLNDIPSCYLSSKGPFILAISCPIAGESILGVCRATV